MKMVPPFAHHTRGSGRSTRHGRANGQVGDECYGCGPNSPIRRFTPTGADIDSVIDVRAVFQQGHRDLKVEELPSILIPRKGCFGLIDGEKAYCPDLRGGPDIFDLRGIDRVKGAMVVVRPDQYVSNVLPLDAHAELAAFFGRFLLGRHYIGSSLTAELGAPAQARLRTPP